MQATLRHLTKKKRGFDGVFIVLGILFSFLWASAATATKIGLEVAQPFVIALMRFLIAGAVMLLLSHGVLGKRLPKGKEWKQLLVYGFFNITAYLGFYVLAMQEVSAGFGSLAVATNPVFISLLASMFLNYRLRLPVVFGMLICFLGVAIVAHPLMQASLTTWKGILTMTLSMVAYSIGTLYYARVKWEGLHMLSINGWQTLLGGILLLPSLFFTYESAENNFNLTFFSAVLWLAIPVSIVAVWLWLYLLKEHPVKASYWLFLCPVFGFFIARVFVQEPINLFTVLGVTLVVAGLYLLNRKKDG